MPHNETDLEKMEQRLADQHHIMEELIRQQIAAQQQQQQYQQSQSVRSYLTNVAEFQGNSEELVNFISSIDKISPVIDSLSELEKLLAFEQIKIKLVGNTKCILREYPQCWKELKSLLIRSYSDQDSLGSLQDQLEEIRFDKNILSTFQLIQQSLSKILDKIHLSGDEETMKIDRTRHAKERAYRHFRSIIPESCKACLNGNRCQDIYGAINILTQEGLLQELPFNCNTSPHIIQYDHIEAHNYHSCSDFYKSLPFIELENKGQSFRFVIDTGSDVNIIKKGICRNSFPIDPYQIKTIKGFAHATSKCTLNLPEMGGKEIEFIEFNFSENFDALLGYHTLKKLKATIDCGQGTLRINGRILNLGNQKSILPISTSNHIENNEPQFKPNDSFSHLYIDTDNPINCFSNQFVFLSGDKEEISTLVTFKKKRTIIKSPNYTDSFLTKLFAQYISHKRKIAIYFENSDIYDRFKSVSYRVLSPQTQLRILISNQFLTDVASYSDMYSLISDSHQKSNHGDPDLIFSDLVTKYYKHNLKSMIKKFVSSCNDCHPKRKETPLIASDVAAVNTEDNGKCHETFEIEIWELYKKKFVCVIDQYSLFTQLYELKGSSWMALRNCILRAFNDVGTPQRINFSAVNKRLLSNDLINWLNAKGIASRIVERTHVLERCHSSITQRIQLLESHSIDKEYNLITAALYNYNTDYMKAIKNVPQFMHLNNGQLSVAKLY